LTATSPMRIVDWAASRGDKGFFSSSPNA